MKEVEVFSIPMEAGDSEGVVAFKLPPGGVNFIFNFAYPKQLFFVKNEKEESKANIYVTDIEGVDYDDDSRAPTPGQLAPFVMVEENVAKTLESGQSCQMPFIDKDGCSRLLVVRNCLDDSFMPVRN